MSFLIGNNGKLKQYSHQNGLECSQIAFIYVLVVLKFSLGRREETAHEEAIWAIDWYRGPEQAIEGSKLITGSLDDSVKVRINSVMIWQYNEKD